jgi:DNA invertase Pin-like site-specific DNA recombinase
MAANSVLLSIAQQHGQLKIPVQRASARRHPHVAAGKPELVMGTLVAQAGVYEDAGISGAKGRDKRPGFDRLLRDATARKVNMIATWSVDRLGRSLQDLVGFLTELHALKCDLYLHQQALDTSTPSGRCLAYSPNSSAA